MDREGFGVIALVLNIIISFAALIALGEFMHQSWDWPEMVTYPLALMALAITGGLAAPLAIWAAYEVWDWPVWLGICIFMWPAVAVIFLGAGNAIFEFIGGMFSHPQPVHAPFQSYDPEVFRTSMRRAFVERIAEMTLDGKTQAEQADDLQNQRGFFQMCLTYGGKGRDHSYTPEQCRIAIEILEEMIVRLKPLRIRRADQVVPR